MPAELIARIEGDLCKIGEELWNIDSPSGTLDKVLDIVLLLKAQLEVHKSLQSTAILLRQTPSNQTLPNQKAGRVKTLVLSTFQENSSSELSEQYKKGKKDKNAKGKYEKLRELDCDALKLCGLCYTMEEIVKLGDREFEFLRKHAEEFISCRKLSSLFYRYDVNKAIDSVTSKFADIEHNELYEEFIRGTQYSSLQTNLN